MEALSLRAGLRKLADKCRHPIHPLKRYTIGGGPGVLVLRVRVVDDIVEQVQSYMDLVAKVSF